MKGRYNKSQASHSGQAAFDTIYWQMGDSSSKITIRPTHLPCGSDASLELERLKKKDIAMVDTADG